jgi:serine protease Do
MKNIRQQITGRRFIIVSALVVALIATFAIGVEIGHASHRHSQSLISAVSASGGVNEMSAFATSFAQTVKNAQPAVVSIASTKVVKSNNADEGLSPLFNDPMFRQFFGERGNGPQNRPNRPREQREQGLGSGVIISPDGYILTNNHVIEGANDIRVYTSDKRELKARVIGADPNTDIAVVKVDEKKLATLSFADSSQVQVGDIALAIGNPFGVGQTVTMGIISATGRGNLGIEDYEDFIQTDAAINPGNSGGALINSNGQLIGINTAILSHAGGNQGVGFAVPANLAHSVMSQLLKNGKVVRGYLGVMIQPVTPEIAKAFNLADAHGALVGEVSPDGPAAKAGIAQGDVITELNGARVDESRDLRLKISQLTPGSEIRLKLLRDGNPREASITLGELPTVKEAASNEKSENDSYDGISVESLTPQTSRQLGLPASISGVVVTDVQDGSRADDAGLRPGDLIQQVNRQAINTAADFERAMKQSSGRSAVLLVNRNGHTSYVVIAAS